MSAFLNVFHNSGENHQGIV